MKRIFRHAGQLLFDFVNGVVKDKAPQAEVETEIPQILTEPLPLPVNPLVPPPAKQRKRQVLHFDKPTVVFHKKGRTLAMKPSNFIAARALADVRTRIQNPDMNRGLYFGLDVPVSVPSHDLKQLQLWRHVGGDIKQHPMVQMLASYGVDVHVHPCLANWMKKEARRQELEATPYPAMPISINIKLFERCSEGTILRCRQDYVSPGGTTPIFRKGERYFVVSTGAEGEDAIVLCTEPVKDKAVLNFASGATHKWTSFDPDMEEWFDDSEETDFGQDLVSKYPGLIANAKRELEKMGLALFDHVREDVVLMSLKRGGINAYPMRMGKTSFAISWAALKKGKKVAFIGPRNARIFTVKELQRLGFKQDQDFVVVDKLSDLEKTGKFYLLTYTWLRRYSDPEAKARGKGDGYLHPSKKWVKQKNANGIVEEVAQGILNPCPHCKQPMERFAEIELADGDTVWTWTTSRGFMCRNKECDWVTDNRGKEGAAWNSKRTLTRHKGGYVDIGLAAHAQCPDEKVRGRMCPSCKQVDGVWTPGVQRRIKKNFSDVIADEIHAAKAHTTDTAKALYALRPKRRLGLTGTLISNDPTDAYWPLTWATRAPNSHTPYFRNDGFKEYEARFCDHVQIEKPAGQELDEDGNTVQLTQVIRKRIPFLKNPPDFWRFMAPKVIRRTYDDPLYQKSLVASNRRMPDTAPPIVYRCPMDKVQAKVMLDSIKDFKQAYEKMQKAAADKGQEVNSAMVISQMSMLRIVATCPEALNERFGEGTYKGQAGGGKLFHVEQIVKEKVEKGGKVLILSDFIATQKTLQQALKAYAPIRFNTSWDDEARKEAFDQFQYGDDCKVFIAGTRAVREGVDLSRADTCICMDLLWSPAFQTQAWSRILAPQERERKCEIYLMLSQNSLDEHIYTVFYSKMIAAQQAMDRKVMNRRNQEFDVKQFVDRVLQEEEEISHYLVDNSSSDMIMVPDLDLDDFAQREA